MLYPLTHLIVSYPTLNCTLLTTRGVGASRQLLPVNVAVLVGLEPDEVENGSGERDREGGRASEPGSDRDVRLDRDLDRGKLDGLGTEISSNRTFLPNGSFKWKEEPEAGKS